ncbi:MAG: type VI secretion system baseplate subunit TssK [Sedimentisphaerales bacterium]|nr:type VI secretion system baseplate subunit TssK [Sedimentisphaerales bacterium]
MTDSPIHWYEGLFLQPHHLQSMQKHFADSVSAERRRLWVYPYGVLKMRLSDAELENHRIRFDELHVVMPSGLELRVPENTDIPSVNIKEAIASAGGSLQISIGVPIWQPAGRNVIDGHEEGDWRTKRLYRVSETEVPDENTGENPQVVRVRRVNARLLLGHEDCSDLEVLPLLRVVQAVGDELGLPRQDTTYVPPCLIVSGSAKLRDLIRDITSQVLAGRGELVLRTARGGFSIDRLRGAQFEQLLRLRSLNRWGAVLETLGGVLGRIPPFEMYVHLRQLLAELAALRPDRDVFDVPPYDHDNPLPCFEELSRRIPPLLRGTVEARFLKVSFAREEDAGCMCAALDDEALSKPTEYYLAIRTKWDPKQLAVLVEDRDKFKLMPRSWARKLVYGIRLAYEAYPPMELPTEVGLCYFRLMRHESKVAWERVAQEKAVAATWPEAESSDFALALYMPVP